MALARLRRWDGPSDMDIAIAQLEAWMRDYYHKVDHDIGTLGPVKVAEERSEPDLGKGSTLAKERRTTSEVIAMAREGAKTRSI